MSAVERTFLLSEIFHWRSSVTMSTGLPREEAQKRLAALGLGELRRDFEPPGRAWVGGALRCTVRDLGEERVVDVEIEAFPRVRWMVYGLLAFLVLLLPTGALDLRQGMQFSAIFLGVYVPANWAAAGLVIKREAKALAERMETALREGSD